MKSKQLKFLVGSVAILIALGYFGLQGFNESMSYSKTVPELYASGDKAYDWRSVKVQGEVVKGSIRRDGTATVFSIGPKDFKVPVNSRPAHPNPSDPIRRKRCPSRYLP
jgi:cytochrome c-type biogenesis protein CcmE